MNDNNFDSIPKPRYVTEYRKFGDMFKGHKPGDKSFLDKFILQTFISLVIIALVLFINNIDTSITNSLSRSIRTTISWNVDFSKAIDTFANIKNLIPQAKKSLIPESKTENKLPAAGENLVVTTENSEKTLFIMPVEGEITSPFGERVHPVFKNKDMHNGVDISAELGTPIMSATSGEVIKVAKDDINGNYLKIKTDDYEIAYAHCLKVLVTEGQQVKQGQEIAQVGDTGLASGPHLHFEVKENGQAINPIELLNQGSIN